MGVKTILDVSVKDVEKRRFPTKHYVYVLEVRWSEGTTTVVFRRYSDFFEFQCHLLERFPDESGSRDPAARMIPFLPGKKLFGRSAIRTVAEKRKEKIDLYCRTLVRLPPKISEDSFVLDFFEVRDSDLNRPSTKSEDSKQQSIQEISGPLILERYVAIADYDKQKKNECSMKAGQTVEVVDKNQNGWWFVNVDDFHEGWVPATYLEPLYGSEDPRVQKLDEEEVHVTLNAYTAQHDDEVSFEKGVLVEVFEKGMDGWWKIRYQDKEGMAPAAYLHKYVGSVGGSTTGAEVVTSVKEAVLSTSSSDTPTSPKPPAKPKSPRSNTNVKSMSNSDVKSMSHSDVKSLSGSDIRPISPKSPTTSPDASTASLSAKEILSASLALSSKRPSVSSPPPSSGGVSSASLTAASNAGPALSPSPKPAKAPEKQTFAPTFHSQVQAIIDKEPIYAPTPRRKALKAQLKKKAPPPVPSKPHPSSTSPVTTPTVDDDFGMDFPEPVYEIIPEPEEEIYVTIAEFSASNAQDGLSFGPGENCTVITKNPTGWWFVELKGQEGWVPSSYLENKKKSNPTSPAVKSPPPAPVLPPRDKLDKKLARKKDISPATKRRETTASAMAGKVPVKKSPPVVRSYLKRSNSSDSLVEEKPKRPAVKRTHSPPSVPRSTGWQPQPAKQPVLKSRTIRPDISKPSTIAKSPRPARSPRPTRASQDDRTRLPPDKVKSTISAPTLKVSSPNLRTTSIGTRPPPPKPTSAPTKTGTAGHRRGSSDGPRPPPPARRMSNEGVQQNGFAKQKTELEKKLQMRKAGTLQPAGLVKKASPPQRPKPPPPNGGTLPVGRGPPPSNGGTLPASRGPPRRPDPPKNKRPPPPRPGKLPVNVASKRTKFVTVSDYSGGADGCLDFKEGEVVEVLEKNDDGWWFVKIGAKEGWVPSTFLEEKEDTPPELRKPPKPNLPPPKPNEVQQPEVVADPPKPKPRPRPRKTTLTAESPTKAPTTFSRAIDSYDAPTGDDSAICLVKGRVYEVRDKNENGWWLIKDGDLEGWAPGTYLDPI